MTMLNTWGPVVLIILGYVLGLYFQQRGLDAMNKRLDDFKEGLYKYLGAEFGAIKERLSKLEEQRLIK